MKVSLNRIILFVHDVNSQKQFYQTVFGFALMEEIPNEWVVLGAGAAELALHNLGPLYNRDNTTKGQSNLKLVFEIDVDICTFREHLITLNVPMRDVKYFDDNYLLCDGEDPEGNVFQLKMKR
jgi:catechol-2,3-dioxygenase